MKRKLRIVHCFRSPMGGIFRHVRDLAEAQVAAGHEVGIICDSSTGGAFEQQLMSALEGKLPLGIRRTPMQRHVGLGDLGAAWRTYQLIKELKPDVLHGHGAKGGAYSRLFGSLFRVFSFRVARIYSPHGGSLHYDEKTGSGRLFFLLERLMGRLTDGLLFVSEHEMRSYRRKVGAPPSVHRLVYNGLRAEEFELVEPRADAADFLYVGMMRDLKGPDIFIDALADASGRVGRCLSAAMIGDGADLPRYRQQAALLGERIAVDFHPAMPAREAFSRGRVMVVPSRAEAMPYIVLEALAAGRPMIATAVGGIPEILGRDSRMLVEPDGASLAGRMTEAVENIQNIAAAMPAQSGLRERFSASAMAQSIEAVYYEALGHG